MDILHITDLHYNSNSYEKFTQSQIIEKLVSKITSQRIKFDLIFFTGDLVFNGSFFEDFDNAKTEFIDKICESLNFDKNNVIFCAGNHDMDRSGISKSLEEHFNQRIKNNDQLYDFFNQQDNDYHTSIKTTENYNKFIKSYYKNDSLYDLYSIHKRTISNNDEIGIFSLNSSWRSVDDFSEGKLLFPTHLLESGLDELKSIKNRFLLMHHPLHWFADYNKPKLQELIFKNFNIIFTGHVHESEITTHYTKSNGIFINTCPATMTWDKNFIGYSIIKYDSLKSDFAVVSKYKFIDEKDDFDFIDRIEVNIPCGILKTEQNKLQEKINNKSILELLNSKDLLLSKNFDSSDNLFLDLFNKPKLSTRPKEEINESTEVGSSSFDFDLLLDYEQNYFIFGNDKSGKTSLLKYIQIKHLKDYATNGIIPFYIDLKSNYNSSVFDEIRKYYELSIRNTQSLIEKDFLLLIDNFDINSTYYDQLIKFLDEYENVKFIISSDYYTYRIFENYKIDNREYYKLYLQDVTRKEVRNFLESNKFEINDSYDNVLEKIISFCKQLELPLNYWTISLILLVHKKQKFDLSKNIYNLLDLCVDEILDKKHMTLRNSKLEFNQLKSLCGDLAVFLLKNNSENVYSKSYLIVLEELDRLIKTDIRVKADPKETLDYLINSGILKHQDEKVSFRLNGIFEFFIALHMSENEAFRDEIINDDKIYLSFKNEFEICSGILNKDLAFYNKIYEKTILFFNPVNQKYLNIGKQDIILKSKVTDKNDVNLKKITQELKTFEPLDNEKKDFIKDQNNLLSINSELHLKKLYDVNNFDPEIFERYISIFTRVFKTMEGIKDLNLLSGSLDFILNTYINFGFFLYEEIEQELEIKETDDSDILSLISKILPFISQMSMTENIAHYNIEKVIISKIEELKKDYKENQYKLFVLYFILMDIDENNIFKYADEVIELVHIGILKYSSIIKFKYYFSFKGKENTKLANFLKEKIKLAQMKLNSKTNVSSLQSSLDSAQNRFNK